MKHNGTSCKGVRDCQENSLLRGWKALFGDLIVTADSGGVVPIGRGTQYQLLC